jgi:hypothetical protein
MTIRRSAAKALISAVGALAALGFTTAVAHADGPGESPIDVWSNYNWCPGDPIPQADAPITWDMNICHDWHYQSMREGAPSVWHVVEGRQGSTCPPFAYMCP